MRRWLTVLLLASIALLVLVDSLDDVYRSERTDITVLLPVELGAGVNGTVTVIATDLNGAPKSGEHVSLEVRTKGSVKRYSSITGLDGSARIDVGGIETVGPAEVTVSAGGKRLGHRVQIVNVSKTSIIIQTDKTVYQPGQTVHMRFLTYDLVHRKPLTDAITVEVLTPEGDKVLRESLSPNDYGICALDYPLSDLLPLGVYTISARTRDQVEERTISVDRYLLPKFIIQASGLKGWYCPSDTISVDVSAVYSFGKPVVGTFRADLLLYSAFYGYIPVGTVEGELNGSSHIEIDLEDMMRQPIGDHWDGMSPDRSREIANLFLNVSVTDTAGHTEHKTFSTLFSTNPITITVIGDKSVAGLKSNYWLIITYPDGSPVQATIDAEIISVERSSAGQAIASWSIETDARGVARLVFATPSKPFHLILSVRTANETSTETLTIRPSEEGIKVVPDRLAYRVGERASFTVYASSAISPRVYYDVYSSGMRLLSGSLRLVSGSGTFSFTLNPDMVPGIEVHVMRVSDDLLPFTSSVKVPVVGREALEVLLIPSKRILRPGEPLSVEFAVHMREMPVQAAIGVRIVDTSVFELAGRLGSEDLMPSDDEIYSILRYAEGIDHRPTSHGFLNPSSGIEMTLVAAMEDRSNADVMKWRTVGLLLTIAMTILAVVFIHLTRKVRTKSMLAVAVIGLMVLPTTVLISTYLLETSHLLDLIPGGETEEISAENPGNDGAVDVPEEREKNGYSTWDMRYEDEWMPDTQISSFGDATVTSLRSFFPETWYWNPMVETDEHGRAEIHVVAPDTITTWKLEAFATTLDCLMKSQTINITVFQSFFVEPELPERAVLGDEFQMNVMIYNYLETDLQLNVTVESENISVLSDAIGSLIVGANSVSAIPFTLKAEEVGEGRVRIDATDGKVADSVLRTVQIVSGGDRREFTISGILLNTTSKNVEIEFSDERIPGSEIAYVKLEGSMGAMAMDGAEEYINYVRGCGEQSMSTLAMNVLAYRFLDPGLSIGKRREYEHIVMQGIQHELTFLKKDPHGDGRGIVWFPSDPEPHPWLTSWGLITFQDAIDSGFTLDQDVIDDMQMFILSRQRPDGSYEFPEWGLYEYTPYVLRSKTVSATAYVAWSLLYSGYRGDALERAVDYLNTHLDEVWADPYSLALSLIVLQATGSPDTIRVAERLAELAISQGDGVYWEGQGMIDASSYDVGWRWRSSPGTVETTGYCVMALNDIRQDLSVAGIRYLLNHRSSTGFYSTRDTVVAFQAIASRSMLKVDHMKVRIYANDVLIDEIEITAEDADVTRYVDLRPFIREKLNVTLKSTGRGQIAYQVCAIEHLRQEKNGIPMSFQIEVSSTNVSAGEVVNVTATVIYNGSEPMQMLLIELPVPAGFTVDADEDLMGACDNVEIKNGEICIYMSPVDPFSVIRIPFVFHADSVARSAISGAVAYDMYNPNLRAIAPSVHLTVH